MKKYKDNKVSTHAFTSPFLNIGIAKYVIVNANTKELNEAFPYELYWTALQIVLSFFMAGEPDIIYTKLRKTQNATKNPK